MLSSVKATLSNFSGEFPATHLALSDVRQQVGAWLRERGEGSDILIGDVEMVLTELAANVIDHTASAVLDITVELPGDLVTVEVSNAGPVSAVPPVEVWGQLSEGTRGRGLRIIRALCTAVVVTGNERQTRIRCDIAASSDCF